ncbi:MAG: hypothetical protein LAO21_18130 [Acidobacteriia bacterium]|nr:hypothetical protein [Terriglobia bacterium]
MEDPPRRFILSSPIQEATDRHAHHRIILPSRESLHTPQFQTTMLTRQSAAGGAR